MSVASKERPAPWDGPAILLSDQDALGLLLFLPALSHLIGLRLVGRVIRIWRRLLVGHRSFPLHKLADDHGLDRCGDFDGSDCADARCLGASDFYRWASGRRGPFRTEHDEQINQDDANYGAVIQHGDAAGELIARPNRGTGRRRQQRDETSSKPSQVPAASAADSVALRSRTSISAWRFAAASGPVRLSPAKGRGQAAPAQTGAEQHSIFFLADMRKQKGVELRLRRQNRRRIFHADH